MGMVVNVDNWGSGPDALTKGDVVPADSEADIKWATANGVIVTEDEYRLEHPEWKPPAAEADAEAAPAPSKTSTRATSSSSS